MNVEREELETWCQKLDRWNAGTWIPNCQERDDMMTELDGMSKYKSITRQEKRAARDIFLALLDRKRTSSSSESPSKRTRIELSEEQEQGEVGARRAHFSGRARRATRQALDLFSVGR
jgi:hypothetical protein